MITPPFTKLQRCIITSSIWLHDAETRLVWITLLALCDRDGIVRASPLGIAHQARVSEDGCARALQKFQEPDTDSRDGAHDGRRIERVPEGFLVLNYERVMKEGARAERREYMAQKQRESRARRKAKGGTIRPEHVEEKTPDAWEGLPAELNTPGFREAWEQYVAYRRKARIKPLLPESVRAQWRKLATYGPDIARLAIGESIGNGWQGIFPERVANGAQGNLTSKEAAKAREAEIHTKPHPKYGW